MAHPIMIPDDLYVRIAAYAARQGQTPDEMLVILATEAIEQEPATDEESAAEYDPAGDPLAPFAGIGASDDPSWIDDHDLYLAHLAYGESADGKNSTSVR